MYEQFDTIVYPKNTKISKSYWNTFVSTVTFAWLRKSKEKSKEDDVPENFMPLTHQEMSNYCLDHYLLKYKEILCCGHIPEGFDIYSLSVGISFIYNSLCIEKICPTSDPPSRLRITNAEVARSDFKEVRDVLCS